MPALGSERGRFEDNASRVSAYPVFAPDKSTDSVPIAIITRHTNLGESRMPNKLQLNFVAVGEELLKMISQGYYPTA